MEPPKTQIKTKVVPSPQSLEREVRYLDTRTRNFTSALLVWADAASESLFADPPWKRSSKYGFVMRKVTLQIFSMIPQDVKKISVTPYLARVGNSSFEGYFELKTSRSHLFAKLWSLMVLVDRNSIRPVSIPREKRFQIYEVPPKPAELHGSPELPAKEADFVWESIVRVTDCDGLGHLNNTKYALLAEEAIEMAIKHGAFQSKAAKELSVHPVETMHIEYIDQVIPLTILKISLWFDEEKRAFFFKYENQDKEVSRIVTRPSLLLPKL